MDKMMVHKLETLKSFQVNNPLSHVGGSIGLFMHGVDLKRDLGTSDLDITVPDLLTNETEIEYEHRSDANDFDYSLKKVFEDGLYVKIDIRVCPEPSFEEILYDGVSYNVSKYNDIIFWKTKYAKKGVLKHENDLIAIKTGIRPEEPVYNVDELPF